MENKDISETLALLADLKELFGEDPFRVSSVRNAARKIMKMPLHLSQMNEVDLQNVEGIGKSVAKSIIELRQTGKLLALETLRVKTPIGVVKMLDIPGIGPKKVHIIWKTLGIESISELRYACNENRLIEAKGFGIKTQNEILKNLEFFEAHDGLFLYPKLMNLARAWEEILKTMPFFKKCMVVGDLRRKMEFSDRIEIVVAVNFDPPPLFSFPSSIPRTLLNWIEEIQTSEPLVVEQISRAGIGQSQSLLPGIEIKLVLSQKVPLVLNLVKEAHFPYFEFLLTGSIGYIKNLKINPLVSIPECHSELELFNLLGIDYLEPELRENWEEISKELNRDYEPPISETRSLIQKSDLKGALHNHSTYSDGINTLEDMAKECQKMGLEYFGICDHSKTAVYAGGLSIQRVKEQLEEIDKLNQKFTHFKIFKGIESDILGDGSLDYPDEILESFDFVVASVHSNLKMDKSRAMHRLLTAIENPYTTILGHPTGRLLLGREGYPLDMELIIEACIKNQVVMEINANPNRLDIDWRWIPYGLHKGLTFSINPDAHRLEGLKDMDYGIGVARKAALSPKSCLNAMSLSDIQEFFIQRKKLKQTA